MERRPPEHFNQIDCDLAEQWDLPPPRESILRVRYSEKTTDRPELVSSKLEGAGVWLTVRVGGRSIEIRANSKNAREELAKVFTNDLVDVILGERPVPRNQQAATRNRITVQYKQEAATRRHNLEKRTPGVKAHKSQVGLGRVSLREVQKGNNGKARTA